jgi:hypothetical protein
MLMKQSVIGDEALKVLEGDLGNYFGNVKDGKDLDSVVAEILSDRSLFTFLAINLEEGKGLRLDYCEGFDNIAFYKHYGLTLDFNVPRKIKMFGFESLNFGCFAYEQSIKNTLELWSSFPYKNDERLEISRPSVEDFCRDVNMTLQDPRSYVVQLPSK